MCAPGLLYDFLLGTITERRAALIASLDIAHRDLRNVRRLVNTLSGVTGLTRWLLCSSACPGSLFIPVRRLSFAANVFVIPFSSAMPTNRRLPVTVLTRGQPRLSLWREMRAVAHKSALTQFAGHRETEQHAVLRIGGRYIDRFQTRLVLQQRVFNFAAKRVCRSWHVPINRRQVA